MPATIEAPEPAQPPELSPFQQALAAANARAEEEPTQEAPEAPHEPEAAAVETSPAPAAAPAPTGPSPEWKAIAESRGVPPEMLALARDDNQVQQYIALLEGVVAKEQPQPQPAEERKSPWLLNEEEFDPTDPTHRQLKAAVEHIDRLEKTLEEKLTKISTATTGLIKQRQAEEQLAKESDYDAGLDALNMPELGASKSLQRRQAYTVFEALLAANPATPRQELAKRAALATFPELVTKQAQQAQLAALKNQESETLGGGPAKPAPKKEPTKQEDFRAFLREKSRKAREAGLY